MTNGDNPLLEALEDLTKTIHSKVIQGDRLTPVELPSLLTQLDDAIFSSMGSQSAGASLAFEGAPLNTAALHAAMKIGSQVKDWCHAVKVIPARAPADTAKDLTAWYDVFSRSSPELEVETYRAKVMRGWANQIRSMLNPARERDLPDACPVCGADSWFDPRDGKKYPRPLIVRYRPEEDNMLDDAKGTCRACEATWGARELAFALEEQENPADHTA